MWGCPAAAQHGAGTGWSQVGFVPSCCQGQDVLHQAGDTAWDPLPLVSPWDAARAPAPFVSQQPAASAALGTEGMQYGVRFLFLQ